MIDYQEQMIRSERANRYLRELARERAEQRERHVVVAATLLIVALMCFVSATGSTLGLN
jgi:cytochrome b